MLQAISAFTLRRLPATSTAIANLYAAVELQQRDVIVEQLRLLRSIGDSTALPSITSYDAYRYLQGSVIDPEVLFEWNATVDALVQHVPIHGYFWFHTQRSHFYATLVGAELTVFAAFDRQGKTREQAVRTLDDTNPQVIAAQIVRLVDWVEPVRRFAERNLSALLEIDMIPAATLVECLPLVVELERYQIVSPGIKARFHDYLQRNIAILRAGVAHREGRIARAASIIAASLSAQQQGELLELGLKSRDPLVRLHWAEVGLASDPTRQMVYAQFRNERVPAIRLAALRSKDEHESENAQVELEKGLFDSAARIRQFCQFALRQRGISAQERYRRVLDQPASARSEQSLLGLAECGDQSDLDYALFYIDSDVPRVRSAALRLLAKYATDEHQGIVWQLLEDPTPKVARIAARILQTTGTLQHTDWSRRYAEAALAIKRLLIHIARRLPREQRKQAFAQALSDPVIDEDLRSMIQGDYWYKMYVH